jgi:hypothetical protein
LGTFIFSANLSFNVLENPQFQNFVKILNPAYKLPSHDKIGSTVLDKVYDDVRITMEKHLNGTNGIILQDGWSTNQNDSVIAHCIRSGENTHFLSTCQPSVEKGGAD